MTDLLTLARRMLSIRIFEERLLELFSQGQLAGTTHACIGQEAVVVGLFDHLTSADLVFSNHRCHGHYLMHQQDARGLLAELLGKAEGTCGGVGGSQHLHRGNFYSNGVQGGVAPALVGMAWAERFLGEEQAIAVVFLGDGTLGQGQVYEAFNLASLYRLPVLFVIEHNGYSQSTPSALQIAGSVAARPQAFGIPLWEVDSNEVLTVREVAGQAVQHCRQQRGPVALLCHTFRLCSHSKSDDARPAEVIEPWKERDPLRLAQGQLGEATWQSLQQQTAAEFEQLLAEVQQMAPARNWDLPALALPPAGPPLEQPHKLAQGLNAAFHKLLADRPQAVLVGMDILDPYGGAFKVEKGLSTRFPGQVLATPVCETSMAGMCGGMALRGLRPIMQVMFGDFCTLTVEPVVNYISKYRGMYNNQARCPVVIRAAMGGGRGYGPTHSQSLEKLFLGIPDLRVVATSSLHDPQSLLFEAVDDDSPVLLLENKVGYARLPWEHPLFSRRTEGQAYPTAILSGNDFRFSDGVIACYGGTAELALEASLTLLRQHDLAFEVVVFSLVYPCPLDHLQESLRRGQGRLITLEEGTPGGGWGAELIGRCAEQDRLRGSRRVASRETAIPSARALEEQVLPSCAQVVRAALELKRGRV